MGQHYIPQKYLRGFEDQKNPGIIWMYDKKLHKFSHAPIKVVAQQKSFYDDEVEQQLNELVEKPANRVLVKLRELSLSNKIEGATLDKIERATLALYIGTMLKRIPKYRQKACGQIYHTALDDTINEVSSQILRMSQEKAVDAEMVALRLSELELLKREFTRKPPVVVSRQIRDPWPSNQILSCISSMTWRIAVSPDTQFYITSDNPAYFFESYGIGNPESEMTLPLASDIVLLTSWQGQRGATLLMKAKPQLVKEVNRRIASGAERFLFSCMKEDWISLIAEKKTPYLSRIQW